MFTITTDIKDERKLWNSLRNQVKKMSVPNGNAVDIGIFQEQGKDLVDYAAYNEFGSEKVNLPERSYMRSTFDEWVDEVFKKIEYNILPVLLEQFSKQRFLSQIGQFMEKAMKQKIRSSKTWAVPNRPRTLYIKGKVKPPLINTTRLVTSIIHKIVDTETSSNEAIRGINR